MEPIGGNDGVDGVEAVLSSLDADDLELADPPPAVWDAISATLDGGQPTGAGTVVEYSIDADDIVRTTGADWERFADENDAPEMKALDAARALWSYMSSDAVREPWQALVSSVRSTQASATVPFRCDAPHARRWFELVLTPHTDGSVQFRTTMLFEELRDPIALLDQSIDRDTDADAVEVCAWCGRGRHGDDWLDIESLLAVSRLLERDPPPPLSHGVCSSCRDAMTAELATDRARHA